MSIYSYNGLMKRYIVTKFYYKRTPGYYWFGYVLKNGDPVRSIDKTDAMFDMSGSCLLDIYDTLVENYQLNDSPYQVIVRDRDNKSMTISDDSGWAIAALTYGK